MPVHLWRMGKKRIVVTCPVTKIAVITRLTYEEVAEPRQNPRLFACPCGETHQLRFAGLHLYQSPPHHAPPGNQRGVR
jgi:hypothetical protein